MSVCVPLINGPKLGEGPAAICVPEAEEFQGSLCRHNKLADSSSSEPAHWPLLSGWGVNFQPSAHCSVQSYAYHLAVLSPAAAMPFPLLLCLSSKLLLRPASLSKVAFFSFLCAFCLNEGIFLCLEFSAGCALYRPQPQNL